MGFTKQLYIYIYIYPNSRVFSILQWLVLVAYEAYFFVHLDGIK